MKNVSKFLSLGFCVIALSACGTQSSRTSLNSNGSNVTAGGGVVTGTGNIYNLPEAYETTAVISGAGGPSPTKVINLSTSHTLKVKVTALSAQNLTIAGYGNWSFPYGCLQVNVTVNGSTKAALMKVDGVAQGANSPCANAAGSKVLDFTNVMTGNGPTVVTISNAVYDNCRTYNPFYYGCYMSAVWMNHMTASQVKVQTDGTWMDP